VFEISGNGDTTDMESAQSSTVSSQKVIIEGVPYVVTETTRYDMRGLKIED